MIVMRNWSVSHFENDKELRIASHESEMGKVTITTVDPEIEPDENLSFAMSIEELEALVAAAKRERDFAASAAAMAKDAEAKSP